MAELVEVLVPDIGDFESVEVIEILVNIGDVVALEDSLLTLESDKATMEIPSPCAGTIKACCVAIGDKIATGSLIFKLEASAALDTSVISAVAPSEPDVHTASPVEHQAKPAAVPPIQNAEPGLVDNRQKHPLSEPVASKSIKAHASPSIRRFARELGVDLGKVNGSGRKGRILKDDVQDFVKASFQTQGSSAPSSGMGIEPIPAVDFSKFGEIESIELSKIKKLTATNLHRAWLNIPHVTQFDEADITELEAFRKSQKDAAAKQDVKLTFLPFLMKVLVQALKQFPQFNASLAPDHEQLIMKKYFHIGIAVETPGGLVVPVVRDVDQKGLYDLARELMVISGKARSKKLMPGDMQGGSFTISSLGGIGGTAFTPIVNAPEVAILGVSRSKMMPVFQAGEFVPRLMLPLSLSYDHRVIDGAEAARFTTYLASNLKDIRQLLL